MDETFYFFLLFYKVLDLDNQKILWLPSIYQFEREDRNNLNHPNIQRYFEKNWRAPCALAFNGTLALHRIRGSY